MTPLLARHNLPLRLTSFVGREAELAEIQRLLTASRLVTLTGAPGVGKTRLALEVGARLADAYADGASFVELAPLIDPTLVPNALAAALGVTDQSGRGLELVIADYLRARRLLLILDNCEHVVSSCAGLVESLLRSCPRLSVLATSREPLAADGETIWRVPSLTQPEPADCSSVEMLCRCESVQLFADRAAAVQPGFAVSGENARAVARICRRLDGIALAVELAAARVRVLTVQQIAERLDDRFRLLVGGSRTALPRHRTLRALVDWSHDLLSEPERVLLRRVSVFAGGWTLEAAEQVCAGDGVAREDVLDLLEQLVDRSLVQVGERRGEARYRLLEMIREYGRERLEQAGETDATCARHLDWCRALAEDASPKLYGWEQIAFLDRLEGELDNFRAALGRGLSDARHAESVQWIVGRLSGFWQWRGHLSEGRRWAVAALQAGDSSRSRARASTLNALGNLARNQGDYAAGYAAFDECRSIAEELGDKYYLARALFGLGSVLEYQGDHAGSMPLVQRSLELGRELGDIRWIALGLGTIGVFLRRLGDPDRSEALLMEAEVLARQVGDRWLIAQAHAHLGVLARQRGDLARAAEQFEAGLALHAQLGNTHDVAWVRNKLAELAFHRGDVARAGSLYAESLAVFRDEGAIWGVAECLEGLAGAAARAERLEQAARLYGAARALRDTAGLAELPADQVDHARNVAAVRAHLGETRFADAWQAGRSMSMDEASEVALEAARPVPTPSVAAVSADEPEPGSPLSARERQVAARIARGLTNRRIATELVIGTRTVDAHVYRILRKLGFESRAQIAAWAVEQRLSTPRSD